MELYICYNSKAYPKYNVTPTPHIFFYTELILHGATFHLNLRIVNIMQRRMFPLLIADNLYVLRLRYFTFALLTIGVGPCSISINTVHHAFCVKTNVWFFVGSRVGLYMKNNSISISIRWNSRMHTCSCQRGCSSWKQRPSISWLAIQVINNEHVVRLQCDEPYHVIEW